MSKSEFDQYAENYDHVLSGSIPAALNEDSYFAEYKVSLMAKNFKGSEPRNILDFGCGSGRSLSYIKKYFPKSRIWGYDVSQDSLKVAERREPEACLFSDWEAVTDIEFDVIMAANVFHHIPAETQQLSLDICYSKLKKNGRFYLFEHNPYNPLTRWVFERCPLDVNAKMLSLQTALRLSSQAGFICERYRYTLFFPRPLAFLRILEPMLGRLPLGAQYYIKLLKA